MSRPRRCARGCVALLSAPAGLAVLLAPVPASAHTDLVTGTPGPGAVVNGAAADLTITFASPLVAEGTQVLVRDPRGVDRVGSASTLGAQARVALEPLTRAGTYTVTYRAVAADGHPITGSYDFRVSQRGASAARTPGPGPGGDAGTAGIAWAPVAIAGAGAGPSGSRPSGPGPSTHGPVIGGVGAAALVLLLVAGSRRRTGPSAQRSSREWVRP